MNWLGNLQTAIDYIEAHLLEDELITGENISAQIFSSEYNFRTIFRVITGYALGEYIRNRRLSLAGEELLHSDATILEIALKYGYDTPESFTKAFIRFHGVSPSHVRKNQSGLKTFTGMILKIQAVGGSMLEYSVEETPPIRLVGYQQSFPTNDFEENNHLIPEFIQHCCQTDFDGICHFSSDGPFANAVLGYRYDINNTLWYAFGVDSKVNECDIPAPYILKTIPAKRWIRFSCPGSGSDDMQQLWYRIYSEFLPCSTYQISDCETLEVSFCRNDKNSRYLYMPIKEN